MFYLNLWWILIQFNLNGQFPLFQISSLPFDTSFVSNPAQAAFGRNRITVQHSHIVGVPELRSIQANTFISYLKCTWGLTCMQEGTQFMNVSGASLHIGNRQRNMATGMSVGFKNYYAEGYYSKWKPNIDLFFSGIFWKGKNTLKMELLGVIPDKEFSVFQLRMENAFHLNRIFNFGIQTFWSNEMNLIAGIKSAIKLHKNISFFQSYFGKYQFIEIGTQISHHHHFVKCSGTLFYRPGCLVSCAYSYSF